MVRRVGSAEVAAVWADLVRLEAASLVDLGLSVPDPDAELRNEMATLGRGYWLGFDSAGPPCGMASLLATDEHWAEQLAWAYVYVEPGSRRHGIGRQLAGAMAEGAADDGIEELRYTGRSDGPTRSFLTAVGFAENSALSTYCLDPVSHIAPSAVAGYWIYRVQGSGTDEATPLVRLRHELNAPDPRPGRQRTVMAVEVASGDVVGFSQCVLGGDAADTEAADTEAADAEIVFTGVTEAHRRKGLARALKRELHAWLAATGCRAIITRVEDGNHAMRNLNAELGYVAVQQVSVWARRLRS